MSTPEPSAIQIVPYRSDFAADVVELIVDIQREEFALDITAAQQPDLADIPSYYQTRRGNFWLALSDDRLIGTLALLDLGDRQAALRKMFVHRSFRGSQLGTAKRLLDALLSWSRQQNLSEIFLGTTPQFLAAHRFYEKHGFSEISPSELPAAFPIMAVDKKFYRRQLRRARLAEG